MGIVYKARQKSLNRIVAVKLTSKEAQAYGAVEVFTLPSFEEIAALEQMRRAEQGR